MNQNILNESRKQNQRMIKIQNQIESIQFSVDNSISSFQLKSQLIKDKNQKYQKFLEGLRQRSSVIHNYTEEILKHEYNLTMEKTNYEIELSKKVKSMRAEDKKLVLQLSACRKRLIEICSQKTQFSANVSSLSKTITILEDEEIKLDKLQTQAERIIAKLNLSIRSDPVSFNNSEIDHFKKLIDFADRQQKLVKQNIEQYSSQSVSISEIYAKVNKKSSFLSELKEKSLDYIYKSNKLREFQQKKYHLEVKIEQKDNLIKELNKKIKKIRKDIMNHKNNECDSFADSRRSMDHSERLSNMREMIYNQINDTQSQIHQIQSTNNELYTEEKALKDKLESYHNELSLMNETYSNIENELHSASSKIEHINNKDILGDQIIESYLKQYDFLKKKIKNEVIENASLNNQLKEPNEISFFYDSDINAEKEKVIKQTDLIKCQISDVNNEMEQIRKNIIHFQLIKDENEAQKDKLNDEIQSKTKVIQECNNLLRSDLTYYSSKRNMNESFFSYEISRHINSRVLSETISQLQDAVNQKRETIQHRKDNLSSQKNSISSFLATYYDDVPTETLKRSIKLAVQENPLQDRIQILSFILENLDLILSSFSKQLQIWKKLSEKVKERTALDDWQIDLNRLSEKADDLIIFNQVFGLAP